MRIKDFVPKNFVIQNFYGKDTCFAWNSTDEFVTFSYNSDSTASSKLLKAPAEIKDIRGLNGRIYILCFPYGIYKLTDKYEFAVLSKTGLEIISQFCVIALNDGMLILEDKTSECTVKLSSTSAISSIHVLALHSNNTNNSFCKALSVDDGLLAKSDLCLVSVDKKLFKLINQTLFRLTYESEYVIKSITAFEKDEQVFGTILQTDSNTVILMYAVENQLFYDVIFLGVNASTVCPILCANNSVLLCYSDYEKTYYSSTVLSSNCISVLKSENKIFPSIKLYQSNFIIYLDNASNLRQVPLSEIKSIYESSTSDYVELQSSMLSGLENVIDIVCEKSQELQVLRGEMLQKEDCLKRMNMFVNKQTLKYCPKDSVLRLLNHLFLVSNYKSSLFENSTVVKVLKSRGKSMFLMKDVYDCDTIVEMPINLSNLSSKLYITTDLITYKSQKGLWCLIRNYIQDPLPSKNSRMILTKDKLNVIKYNLVVLKNMIKENNLSIEKLCEIKRKIRCALDL